MADRTRSKTKRSAMNPADAGSSSQSLSEAQVQELTSQIEARLSAQFEATLEARIAALSTNTYNRSSYLARDYADIEKALPNFSGEKSKFQEFKAKVLMKFEMLDRTGLELDAVTKLDIVFSKLQEHAWNFAKNKREQILADANDDKVAVLLALLDEQYDPVDKHFAAVCKLIREPQGSQSIENYNDHFNTLLLDLPSSVDELLKQVYLCQLNETVCSHARAKHLEKPGMTLASLQGYASTYSNLAPVVPPAASRSAGRSNSARPAGSSAAESPSDKTGKKHEGELRLSLGLLTAVDGWTPTPAEFRRPIAEVPKLDAFLRTNNLCTRCRCPGHWKKDCNGGNYVDPKTYPTT
jgi:hypothetical protein